MNLILGSSGSIQSWASSLSADSQSEEAAVDFMKSFVALLFESPKTIEQEQKFNFGQMVLVSSKISDKKKSTAQKIAIHHLLPNHFKTS